MNLKKKSFIQSQNLTFRDATVSDSEFILMLRLDAKKGQFLSETSASLKAQSSWMRHYERVTDQAYFIIEDRHHKKKLGCIRIYNPVGHKYEWGSWLLVEQAPPLAALESAVLLYHYCYSLGLTEAMLCVRRENKSVWTFHEKAFGAICYHEDDLDKFYKVNEVSVLRSLYKYRRFLVD